MNAKIFAFLNTLRRKLNANKEQKSIKIISDKQK